MWLLRVILPVLALGVIVPYFKGYDFLDAALLTLYALCPLLLSPSGYFTRRDLLRASALTAAIPLISIPLGLAIVSAMTGAPTLPPAAFLATLAALSIASAVFGVALKARLARRWSDPERARRVVLVAIGAVLVLQILGVPLLPFDRADAAALMLMALSSAVLMTGASWLLVRE